MTFLDDGGDGGCGGGAQRFVMMASRRGDGVLLLGAVEHVRRWLASRCWHWFRARLLLGLHAPVLEPDLDLALG